MAASRFHALAIAATDRQPVKNIDTTVRSPALDRCSLSKRPTAGRRGKQADFYNVFPNLYFLRPDDARERLPGGQIQALAYR
jgi:hypothetical protein